VFDDSVFPQGKLDLAYRRNPALRLGPVPLLNDALALQMLKDEHEREQKSAHRPRP